MGIDWFQMGVVFMKAVLVYAFLIFVLRVTGKRTTSKMNSFDWIVTVALGSMAASTIMVDTVSLEAGFAGLAALVVVQFIVTSLANRFSAVEKVIKANPTLLVYRGEFLEKAMKSERMTRGEVFAVLRAQGYSRLDEVRAVVLETNADLSVVPEDEEPREAEETMEDVEGWEPRQLH